MVIKMRTIWGIMFSILFLAFDGLGRVTTWPISVWSADVDGVVDIDDFTDVDKLDSAEFSVTKGVFDSGIFLDLSLAEKPNNMRKIFHLPIQINREC